jgi:acetyl-CoA carboxylase biotin carboxyl carrier protein
MFGVIYLRPSPDASDFVSPGTKVTPGTILCVIEAMKVFNEIRADREGAVATVLVSTGDEVEVGQELMRFT